MKYITTTIAARRADVTTVTVITWCEHYGIGKKIGGRWRVDPEKLQKLLEGYNGRANSKISA